MSYLNLIINLSSTVCAGNQLLNPAITRCSLHTDSNGYAKFLISKFTVNKTANVWSVEILWYVQ